MVTLVYVSPGSALGSPRSLSYYLEHEFPRPEARYILNTPKSICRNIHFSYFTR